MQSITGSTEGIKSYKTVENTAQQDITIKKPYKTPKLNGNDFLTPYLLAFVIDMMLLGDRCKSRQENIGKEHSKVHN
jgi:hypothetical protein